MKQLFTKFIDCFVFNKQIHLSFLNKRIVRDETILHKSHQLSVQKNILIAFALIEK